MDVKYYIWTSKRKREAQIVGTGMTTPSQQIEKLKVPTSEREGKLSKPRGRAARAMQGENLRKFTETRAAAPRASHAVISCQS